MKSYKIKKHMLIIALTSLLVAGCSEKSSSGGSSNNDDTSSSDTGNNGGGSTPPTANNCSGTSADGQGDGYSILDYNLEMAGGQTWVPGGPTAPTLYDASLFWKSDSKFKIRFKIKPQPIPRAGEVYCHGRETGQTADRYRYTKLKFRISLRDIKCDDNPKGPDPNKCQSGFKLGEIYYSQTIGPLSENTCSAVIDLSNKRNSTTYGTVIQVDEVKSDSACQAGYKDDYYCPAERHVRKASCWNMTLQVSTDYTQDFK